MPTSRTHRLNVSDTVRERIENIIHHLVKQANARQLAEQTSSPNTHRFLARWQENEGDRSKLMVKCKTSQFTKLCYPKLSDSQYATFRNNDIKVMKEWLNILEDHRMKATGARDLHFTLTLWTKQPESNVMRLHDLWEETKTTTNSQPSRSQIRGNLPAGNYINFVGYNYQFDRLTNLLSNSSSKLISVDGIAGSGKTSLVLEVTNRIFQAAQTKFDAVVFTSAQLSYCLPQGIVDRLQIERNLSDILRQILINLNTLDIIPTDISAQLASTKQALAAQSTLLIIDNIETNEDRQSLYAFLYELPQTVTTILTSRVKLGLGDIIYLDGLDRASSIILINQVVAQKNLTITSEEIELIWGKTDGIPLAINYIISCAYLAGSIAALNLDLPLPLDSDLTNYCFSNLIEQIRGAFTHRILMALSLFSHPVSRSAAIFITNLEDYQFQSLTALKELEFLNLIFEPQPEYYWMHSLTREYSRQELHQDLNCEANYLDRWVNYYRNYTAAYSELDWNEWQDYSAIDREWLNLRDVVEYCIATDRFADFFQLWQNLHGYTLLCGKWVERLIWLEWWVAKIVDGKTSELDNYASLLAMALYHQSQTLAYRNETDPTGEALQLAHQAWDCCESLDPDTYFHLRFDIAIQIAPLYIRQQQSPPLDFSIAHQWLKTASFLLDTATDRQKIDWYRSHIIYYQAEIKYLDGNYLAAKQLYQSTKQLAEEVGFKRLTNLASCRLAITFKQLKDLEETSILLIDALDAAETNQDRRSVSLCQYHLAIVEHDRGDFSKAKKWGEQAITNLDRLLMQRESANLKTLLSGY
jgi:hypothetical protein